VDERGVPQYRILRFGNGRHKSFRWEHHDGQTWRKGKSDKPLLPYRLPELLEAIQRGETVIIVEGEKDCDELAQRAFTATTNPGGAGKWPSDATFNEYFCGADIVLIPDNDDVGRRHMEQVAMSLRPYAKRIRWLELPGLPEHGDVNDWLEQGHGVRDLQQAIAAARDWHPDSRVQHAQAIYWFFRDGRFQVKALSDAILERHHLVYDGATLWAYDGGAYRDNGVEVVTREAHRLLGEESRSSRIRETIEYIQRECWREVNWDPDDGLVNCSNGLLDWRTETLHPHTPERMSRIQIPVAWDARARCPEIEEFLATVVAPDSIDILLEYLGYCLVPHTRFQRALLLVGRGGDGKSTWLEVVRALLGSQNVTSVSLQDLSTHKYKRAMLFGKVANICADLPHAPVEDSGIFKALVSGDMIDAERKFQPPFQFRPFAKLLFSANELPATADVTDAWFRRWIIIRFERRFAQADPRLIERMTTPTELSGLLRHAVEALRRLEARGGFELPASVEESLREYRTEVDSVAAFVGERCVVDESAKVPASALYTAYKAYCDETGAKPVSNRRFKQRLESIANIAIHHTERGNVYHGVTLLPTYQHRNWAG